MSNMGGTGVYLKRLLSGFSELGKKSVNVVLSSGICTPEEALSADHCSTGFRKVIAENYTLPRIASKLSPDLVHLPAFGGKPPLGVPYVVTLHDLAFMAYPEMFPKIKSMYYSRHFRKTAQNAAMVMVDSEFTADEARRYLDIPKERIRRIYLSTSSFESDPKLFRTEYAIQGEYLLFTGTIEPRKNISLLLDAWEIICKNRPGLTLVIAGQWGWGDASLMKRLGNAKCVLWTGSISDTMLKSCMSGAELLVYPSLYEGFGLPPLEAASAGVKSVIGISETLSEIYGGIAEQMSENTAAALFEAVENALSQPADSDELVRFSAEFSNPKMAENVYSVYREVLE